MGTLDDKCADTVLVRVATGLMKALPMRFSKYTKKCLEDVEKTSEFESDLLLVHLVKIQRLTERIHNWASQEDDEDDISGYLKAPPAAYQVAFHGEIGRLQSSLPAGLVGNSRSNLSPETYISRD